MEKFYNVPTQVAFIYPDDASKEISYGIAYKNEIICGCCGNVFELGDYIEVLEELPWISLREEIEGN